MRLIPIPSAHTIVKFVAVYSVGVLILFCTIIFTSETIPLSAQVTTRMMLGAIILWVGVCGGYLWKRRDSIRARLQAIQIGEKKKFIVVATGLACIEEAITCLMTNLAPLWGGTYGIEGITNTTNYFHLIFLHSVVTFVPAFVAWAFLLERYRFEPIEAFLLYGFTGTLCEAIFIRPDSLLAGYWIFIYGLFVFTPAEAMKRSATLPIPKIRHYIFAIFGPIVVTLPVAFCAIAIDSTLKLPHVGQAIPSR